MLTKYFYTNPNDERIDQGRRTDHASAMGT